MRRAVISMLFCVLAWGAFSTPSSAQDGDPLGIPNPPPAPGPAREYSPEDVARRARLVARVGEARITVGDVEDAVNEQSPFMRARYRDPEQLRTFVQSMVRFELLARAAERANIDEDAEVRRVLQQNAVQQLIRREFDERLRPDNVPAERVREYYEAHPDEFTRAEMRRASHIQLATREEAEGLLTQAREADARTFRTLARDRSVDPETRLRGGDLRYFDDGGRARNARDPRVDEALATAAFGLTEVGDVAGPVQVGERWSVVKLTGRRPAEHRSLEEADPTIRLRLWRQTRQEEMEAFVARLRREANVVVHEERLRPIQLDEPEREDGEADSHGGPAAPPPRAPVEARRGPSLPAPEAPTEAPTEAADEAREEVAQEAAEE